MERRRPLVALALAWIFGIAFSHEFDIDVKFQALFISLGVIFLLALLLFWLKRSAWLWMLFLLVAGLGALREAQSRMPIHELYSALDKLTHIRGLIVEYPSEQSDRTSFLVQPENLPGRIQVFYYHPNGSYEDLRYGDELELSAPLQVPWDFDGFNYREYLLSHDIWAIGTTWTARDIDIIKRDQGSPVLRWGYETRNQLFTLIDQSLAEPASGLLKSLVLGDRSSLEDGIEASFRDAGVLHVLAVSGLNIGIFIALFWGIFRLFRVSFTAKYLLLIPIVLIYLILVGWKVSLVRATLMFGFVALGWLIAERGWILKSWIDPLQGLSLAALIILLVTPQALYDVSFQLSFVATAGILIAIDFILPQFRDWKERFAYSLKIKSALLKNSLTRSTEWIFSLCVISLAAQIAVAPILAMQFHRIYLATLLANLIVVPLATLAIWMGVPMLMAALVTIPTFTQIFDNVETWLLSALIGTTQFFAVLPGGFLEIDESALTGFLVILPMLLSPYVIQSLRGFISKVRFY
ncbi:ComEC/Rec2 family competence protein [Candidatus Acetothermia bacterium]|nr:ComEC/Rec2 family competence protein [Candidatus Acetothermia bacterium]MBI3643082.1 ComEC/Rec2 family competence protein [Candidatus Acetothermia bacterium]